MTGYITSYGNHLGDPRYVLVCDYVAFPLSIKDARRAQEHGVLYQCPALMTDRERDLAHEAWEAREPELTTA